MHMVLVWWGSLHSFDMRAHQNKQIPQVRCYQQGHYQTPQKSSYIYKPLANYLSNSLVWGERKHSLTIGLVRNLTWALACIVPHFHTLNFQGNGQGKLCSQSFHTLVYSDLICFTDKELTQIISSYLHRKSSFARLAFSIYSQPLETWSLKKTLSDAKYWSWFACLN